MAKGKGKKKERKHRFDDPQWQQENRTLEDARKKGPYIKKFLEGRGISLPFYDYIDSYPDEFRRIAESAMAEYPTLMEVREVEDNIFNSPEKHWEALGYAHLTQFFFNVGEFEDYGRSEHTHANVAGCTIAFHDSENKLRTLILLKKGIKTTLRHSDLKYVLKIAALCHEIGHVHDLERGSNFDIPEKRFDVVEGEVFANLFALEMMAERGLKCSYEALVSGFQAAVGKEGYLGQVARTLLERLPNREFIDWQAQLDGNMTVEEARRLGPKAIAALSS